MRVHRLVATVLCLSSVAGCGADNPAVGDLPAGGNGGSGTAGSGASAGTNATTAGAGGASAGSAGAAQAGAQAAGTAGEGSSGGSGGSGGMPHQVASCDGLGAVDEWQEITPPDVDAGQGVGVVSMLADPLHAGTIFVGTDTQGLWKSEDCGATWLKINTGQNADVLDSGTLWELKMDPSDPDTLYAGSLYGSNTSLHKSVNGGVDWNSTHPSGSNVAQAVEYNFFQGMSLDPTDPSHLVITFHANCLGDYAPSCMAESTDSGESWRLFKGPTNGWLEAAGPMVFGANTWVVHTVQDGVFYTDDGGSSWEKLAGVTGSFAQGYRAKDGYLYMPSLSGMDCSADGYAWEHVSGGPMSAAIIGDGVRMFTTWSTDWANANAERTFYSAPEDDPTNWTMMNPPPSTSGSRGNFAYDPDHHLLYGALRSDGVWRLVTQ